MFGFQPLILPGVSDGVPTLCTILGGDSFLFFPEDFLMNPPRLASGTIPNQIHGWKKNFTANGAPQKIWMVDGGSDGCQPDFNSG